MSDKNNQQISLIEKINDILPQTQCTRCGYKSCREYAVAISNNEAEINQCPPGGDNGIKLLAELLNKEIIPLNPTHGKIIPKQVAIIDEDSCIGCTLCIKACPVDAIIGTNKMMHTIIKDECTGCGLCIPVCPVDCISMVVDDNPVWDDNRRDLALMRYNNHNNRILQAKKEREERLIQRTKTENQQKNDLIANIITRINKVNT